MERYLTQAGLYLGVLTNGDEWHLFDFAVGSEPLASFSLVALARLLHTVPTREVAEQRLATQPLLQQALAINLYYLDAQRWEQVDVFREHIANVAYHRIASLQQAEYIELLVQQIKEVLGSLRETIHAQFALLQQRYENYQQQSARTSAGDPRPFTDSLQVAIEQVVQFSSAFRLSDDGQLRKISTLLTELAEQYLFSGDISLFEENYLQKAEELLQPYQISQSSLLGKMSKKQYAHCHQPMDWKRSKRCCKFTTLTCKPWHKNSRSARKRLRHTRHGRGEYEAFLAIQLTNFVYKPPISPLCGSFSCVCAKIMA